MKTLVLVRHASAEPYSHNGLDISRALTYQGKKEASFIAAVLKEKKIHPDIIITSTATRAKETAMFFTNTFALNANQCLEKEALYLASDTVIAQIISLLQPQLNTVIIICHNPGITDFVNRLFNKIKIDNMPPCAVFAVQSKISSWQNFLVAEKQFSFFKYPNPLD